MAVHVIPQLSSILITLVSALVLYFVLKHFLYTPVSDMLSERQENIQGNIQEAEQLKKEARDLKADYEKRIASSKSESQEIMETGRQRGEEIKEDIIREAREEAERIVARSKKDIERERAVAFNDMKAQTGEMAIMIASKIMEEEITLDNQNLLIDKFIDEVGSSKWQN